jgi:serine/threonine protein kinase
MNATRETLAARLRGGPLSPREATQICRALLSAIETAHARGVAHGSVSPQTIVLEQGRAVLVADGVPEGTDALATDLFAVATVLYEAVTGRPWSAGTDPSTADWSGVPRRLERVLRRALSPVPGKRWQDAAAFQRALWVPRPQHPIWPAVVVILISAAIIATIGFCKPLGLCWERNAATATGAGTGAGATR